MSTRSISNHITYKEATKSITAIRLGIINEPDDDQLLNMIEVAEKVFEPLRSGLGGDPININSFFRSHALNSSVPGSAATSQHCKGEAMDLDNDGKFPTNKLLFRFIRDNLTFDQLINEFPDEEGEPEWVHVSYKRTGHNRGEVLESYRDDGKTKYRNV